MPALLAARTEDQRSTHACPRAACPTCSHAHNVRAGQAARRLLLARARQHTHSALVIGNALLRLRVHMDTVLPSTVSRPWSRAWNFVSVPILDQASMLKYLRSRYAKLFDVGTSFSYSTNDCGHNFLQSSCIYKCIADTSVISKKQSSYARDCHSSSSMRTTPLLSEPETQFIPTKPLRSPILTNATFNASLHGTLDAHSRGYNYWSNRKRSNVVRKLPLAKCGLMSRGTFRIEESCTTTLRNLRIVLDFENQGYALEKPLPTTLLEGYLPKEHVTFEKWLEDNRKSLPPSYEPFILKYNIDWLEKFINELINMLVQYEATTYKFALAVLVEEASTSKAKAKRAERKKRTEEAVAATASAAGAPTGPVRMGKEKLKVGGSQWSRANDVCMHCQEKGHWKRECSQLLSNPDVRRSRKLSKDEKILRLGDAKAVAAEAVGSLNLIISFYLMIDNNSHLLGHISEDRMRKLVDSKSLESVGFDFTDVCGPLNTPAIGGYSYFITFTDDYSWYVYVYLMSYKSEAFEKFKEYRLEVEIKLAENLILSQWTPPGTPQLNGVAERRNQALLDMVRSMMSFNELPPSFWGYVLETTAKLLNMVPSKTVPQTPYEIWHGKPASYKCLRVWGSPAYVKRLVGDKLDSRFSLYSRRDEVLLEETSEAPQHNNAISFEPIVSPIVFQFLYKSTRESRPPDRSICGFKQASQSWNTRFDGVTRGYDFMKNEFDPSIYKKYRGSTVAYLVLYVDDILLIGNDVKDVGRY
ncbi:UNVERIFIED_CONTAM: Retrovirus-related Pol polyprotein from transposon TNT 1-94 [Sesamum calycinum]|uniref:Retrovirus-related Pol polyprotein from transposon TNT 1-94 n=1 Tax=Sesamum calycinum TaxID=2727403 RepID=A0AAW2M8Z1_9LAMI